LNPSKAQGINATRAEIAYVVLPRQAESPSRSLEDDAPLVVSLGHEDLAAANAAASSGAPIIGGYKPGPLSWHLGHSVPGLYFIGGIDVIAPPPSAGVSAEIGVLVAEVLTGVVSLRR